MMTTKRWRATRRDESHRLPLRWILPATPISCSRCGEAWQDGDPALQLDCPACSAAAGFPCFRAHGANETVCTERDRAAEYAGLLSVCPSLSWTNRHSKPHPFVCLSVPPAGALPVRTASPATGSRP